MRGTPHNTVIDQPFRLNGARLKVQANGSPKYRIHQKISALISRATRKAGQRVAAQTMLACDLVSL